MYDNQKEKIKIFRHCTSCNCEKEMSFGSIVFIYDMLIIFVYCLDCKKEQSSILKRIGKRTEDGNDKTKK